MIAISLVSVLAVSVTNSTSTISATDTFTMPDAVGINNTLSGYEFVALTTVTNGTTTVDAGNYSIISALDDISAYYGGSLEVAYTYNQEGKLSGASAVLVALLTLIVTAGLIISIRKDTKK